MSARRQPVTELDIANAVARGITPARLELATLHHEIKEFKRAYSVRNAIIMALRERWGIYRSRTHYKPKSNA